MTALDVSPAAARSAPALGDDESAATLFKAPAEPNNRPLEEVRPDPQRDRTPLAALTTELP